MLTPPIDLLHSQCILPRPMKAGRAIKLARPAFIGRGRIHWLCNRSMGGVNMKEFLTTVTQRGQVTIPAEVRRLLGAKTGDKVAFQVEEGQVRLAPASMTLE